MKTTFFIVCLFLVGASFTPLLSKNVPHTETGTSTDLHKKKTGSIDKNKACGAEFIITNATTSLNITSITLTTNAGDVNAQTYTASVYVPPGYTYYIDNSMVPNVGSSNTTGSVTCSNKWSGSVCMYDMWTDELLQSNHIAGGPTHSFSYVPFTCHGINFWITDTSECQ